jgi:hypothetical protein
MTTKLKIATALAFVLAFVIPSLVGAYDETHLDQLKYTKACSKCDLSGANLERANLQGANLRHSIAHFNIRPLDVDGRFGGIRLWNKNPRGGIDFIADLYFKYRT